MQEYSCMQFYKAGRQRLNYIKNNQAQIKAAKYKEFKDALHQNDNMLENEQILSWKLQTLQEKCPAKQFFFQIYLKINTIYLL